MTMSVCVWPGGHRARVRGIKKHEITKRRTPSLWTLRIPSPTPSADTTISIENHSNLATIPSFGRIIAMCEIKEDFALTFVMFLHQGLTPAAHVKIIKICPPLASPPNSGGWTPHLIRHPLGPAKGDVGQKSSIIYIQQGQTRPNFKSSPWSRSIWSAICGNREKGFAQIV